MPDKSVAVVTGASQGIGRATAIRLARDFEAVVLAARQHDELAKTACAVQSAGAEPLICSLDLRLPCSAETLVKGTLDRFGRIDALLNIAGAVPQIDLFEMTDAQWEDGMALKLHGARRLTIRAWDALKASNGTVVLISGSAALDPKPGFAAVATINAAIIALAKAFAEQGIKDGVQVNSVVPGAIMTGRRRSFLDQWAPKNGISVEEGHEAVSGKGWHRTLRRTGGDCRPDGLPGFGGGPLAYWSFRSDGWRRNQRDLGCSSYSCVCG
jgi:3-oxoacyl-[acyl-carrier protein] reductase